MTLKLDLAAKSTSFEYAGILLSYVLVTIIKPANICGKAKRQLIAKALTK